MEITAQYAKIAALALLAMWGLSYLAVLVLKRTAPVSQPFVKNVQVVSALNARKGNIQMKMDHVLKEGQFYVQLRTGPISQIAKQVYMIALSIPKL